MLYVVKANHPSEMCKKINLREFEAVIDVSDNSPNSLDYIQDGDSNAKLVFDMNNKFLVGYGGRKFFMLDLRGRSSVVKKGNEATDERMKQYRINNFLYDSIISMTVCTGAALDADLYKNYLEGFDSPNLSHNIDSDDKKVFVAAKRVNKNQIDVFEFFHDQQKRYDDSEELEKKMKAQRRPEALIEGKIGLLLQKQDHISSLDYDEATAEEDIFVHISHNGRNILFNEKMNRFLVTVKKDPETQQITSSQRRLQHLARDFNIAFCEEDLYEDGFYLACCKDYDCNVRLMHTHRDYFKTYLDWFIEKGTVRFYDLHVTAKFKDDKLETEILVLGLDHNKFTIDCTKTEEKRHSSLYFQEEYDKRNEYKLLKDSYRLIEYNAHDFVEYGAYSMNWPLFSFGDFLGNVYIVNFFDRSIMYRIPIHEFADKQAGEEPKLRNTLSECKDVDVKICCT